MKPIISLIIATCLGLSGCAIHNPHNSNPAVIKAVTLLDAENTANTIAHGLVAGDSMLNNLRSQEPEFVASAHAKLAEIARLNDQANAAILQAKNGDSAVDWKSTLVAVSKASSDVKTLQAFGFKNSNSQQIVQAGFATLLSALSLAGSFGGAK